MKKILLILFAAFLFAYCANGQRFDGSEQFELAPGADYCWVSDGGGKFQIVPCNNVNAPEITINTNAPTTPPVPGDPVFYLDSNTGKFYFWDGMQWILINRPEVTINTGIPTTPLVPGDPVFYFDSSAGDLYFWDGTQWVLLGASVQNGLTKNGSFIELGGVLTKDTKIEDPTDTHDFGVEKGNLSINIQGSDIDGEKSANLTGINPTNDSEAIAKAREGTIKLESRDATERSTLNMLPSISSFLRQDQSGSVTGVYQIGSSINVRSTKGSGAAGLLVPDELFASIYADNGLGQNTKISTAINAISFYSPNVRNNTTSVGEVWTLIDPVTGQGDYLPTHPAAMVGVASNPALTINSATQEINFDPTISGSYDNSTSGAIATSIQTAIDELFLSLHVPATVSSSDNTILTNSSGANNQTFDLLINPTATANKLINNSTSLNVLIAAINTDNQTHTTIDPALTITPDANNNYTYIINDNQLTPNWNNIAGKPTINASGGNVTGSLNLATGALTLTAPSGADDWGTQTVVSNATLTGNGTAASPLAVANPFPGFTSLVADYGITLAPIATSGDWTDIAGKPTINASGGNVTGSLNLATGALTLTAPSGADDWGTQTVVSNTTLTGNGTAASPLAVANPFPGFTSLVADYGITLAPIATSGDWTDITGKPTINASGGNVTGSLDLATGALTLTAPSGADDWGTQTVVSNATLTGNGTAASPLAVANPFPGFTSLVADYGITLAPIATSGDWTDIASKPTINASGGNVTGSLDLATGALTLTAPTGGGSDGYLGLASTDPSGYHVAGDPVNMNAEEIINADGVTFFDNGGDALSWRLYETVGGTSSNQFRFSLNSSIYYTLSETGTPVNSRDLITKQYADANYGGSGGDNWGTQTVVSNATLTGNGTAASPLAVANPFSGFTSLVADYGITLAPIATSGDWSDLSGQPTLSQSGGDVTGTIDLAAGTFTLTAPAGGGSGITEMRLERTDDVTGSQTTAWVSPNASGQLWVGLTVPSGLEITATDQGANGLEWFIDYNNTWWGGGFAPVGSKSALFGFRQDNGHPGPYAPSNQWHGWHNPFVRKGTPASSAATLSQQLPWDIVADQNFLYIATWNGSSLNTTGGTITWKRVALSTF